MLAEVQLNVNDCFQDDENDKDAGGRADGKRQKAARENGDVHNYDAGIGLIHKVFGLAGFVFAGDEVVADKGDAVA